MSYARELIFFWFLWTCGAVWRELSCVWMRCGATCGQGLQSQRSMRMHFLLSAPSLLQCWYCIVSKLTTPALLYDFLLLSLILYCSFSLVFLSKLHHYWCNTLATDFCHFYFTVCICDYAMILIGLSEKSGVHLFIFLWKLAIHWNY